MRLGQKYIIILIIVSVVFIFISASFSFFAGEHSRAHIKIVKIRELLEFEYSLIAETLDLDAFSPNEYERWSVKYEALTNSMLPLYEDRQNLFTKQESRLISAINENTVSLLLYAKEIFDGKALKDKRLFGFTLGEIIKKTVKLEGIISEQTTAYAHLTQVLGTIFVAISFIALLVLGFLIRRDFILPMKEVSYALEQIGRHNFDYKITVKDSGESGEIFHALNNMSQSIRDSHESLVKEVKQRLKTEEELHLNNEQLRSVMLSMEDVVFVIDEAGRFINYHHPEVESVSHTILKSLVGKHYSAVFFPSHFVEKLENAIIELINTEKSQQFDYSIEDDDGNDVWFSAKASMLKSSDGAYAGVVVVCRNITERKRSELEVKKLSVTDHLTQIFNRMKFYENIEEEMKRASRYKQSLSLIMFDIDFFKEINDNFGHDEGDRCLIELVSLVKLMIRETDTFARWGGEEFMLLLPNTPGESALKLAERIREKLEEHDFKLGRKITGSFGVTQYSMGDSVDSITKRVDTALYDAKSGGRNKIIFV